MLMKSTDARVVCWVFAALLCSCADLEPCLERACYFDADGDGWGYPDAPVLECECAQHRIEQGGDCDDADPAINPMAEELCNGIDDDCDGRLPTEEYDLDADGALVCEGDCNDGDPAVHPDALEICDGIDDNCDGLLGTEETDADGDGYLACGGDCDDSDPGLELADVDGDTWTTCDGDCDDNDPAVFPGAVEACNGIDDDCDGVLLDGEDVDDDDDGARLCDDCDDADPEVYPGAPDVFHVPGDFIDIQSALAFLSSGTMVCVRPGTYHENLDFEGKDLWLRSMEGPEVTVIDGNSNGNVVLFHSGEGPDAVLQGFTLTNGVDSSGGG
jgi:hypothetical protein